LGIGEGNRRFALSKRLSDYEKHYYRKARDYKKDTELTPIHLFCVSACRRLPAALNRPPVSH
jgi:hypothetical protein